MVRILLVGILAVAMLGGCSTDTSVKTYLQALLDASYKNDSTAFVKMKLGTAEDAQALYERGIDTGVSVFCGRIATARIPTSNIRTIFQLIFILFFFLFFHTKAHIPNH